MQQTPITEEILNFWREDKSFQKSLLERSIHRSFRFYDGPPFTSGDPHYGHLLQSTVKDMVPRWMTMRGYRVERKRGWDCHGIPAENFVNKQLGITTKKQVETEYGVGPYVEACRTMVNQVNDNWKWFVDHVGRWIDMENAYFTMDNDFMESVIWVFSDLYNKNLIYKGFKVLGYSRALGTALSASEIAEGYEDRQDPAVTVRFKIQNAGGKMQNSLAENQEDIYERTQDGALIYVLGVVTDENGKLLMLHNVKYDEYQMPGGKVDKGETPEQALAREIKEELGVDIRVKSRICARNLPAKNEYWHGIYFDIELLGTPSIQEPLKHSRMEWVSFEASEENVFGFSMNVVNTIFDDELSINSCYDAVVYRQYLQGITVNDDLPVYFLAWTTTPWTLPSNMFLAVNSKLTYVQIYHKESNCYYILAKNLLSKTFKNPAEYVVIYQMKGKELLGLSYQPIFDYIKNARQSGYEGTILEGEVSKYFQYICGKDHPVALKQFFQVLDADFVTDDAGTGIAHEAPAFGELDYNLVAGFLGRETANEWLFNPVDDNGEFTAEVAEWEGMNVITASTEITKFLKHRGDIIKHETINHSYPHCPRTGTPLIYRAMESRFVKEDQLKAQSVPLAETINFVPPSVKNRFIEGLKSAPDWNISRSRYWGAPLPVWMPESGNGEPLVLGSREEIYQWSKTGSKNITKIVLVRHAQASHNAEGYRETGQNTSITDLGKQQVEKLEKILENTHIDIVLSSPLDRCKQTIENICGTKGIEIIYDDRLLERKQGSSDTVIQRKNMKWDDIDEGGESPKDVYTRMKGIYDEILEKYPGKTILISGHNSGITMFCKAIQDFDFDSKRSQNMIRNMSLEEYNCIVKYVDTNTSKQLDLHRPYIDNIWFMKDGVKYTRILDVLDCWFESGSMPYGQEKYIGVEQGKLKVESFQEGYEIIENLPIERWREYKAIRLEALESAPEAFGPKAKLESESSFSDEIWQLNLQKDYEKYVFLSYNGQIIGMARGGMKIGDQSIGWINNFYVQEAHRRKGWGTKMLQLCENFHASQGKQIAQLTVYKTNSVALHLYERDGFNIIGEQSERVYGTDIAMWILEKKLPTKPTTDNRQQTTFDPTANFIAEGLDQTRGWFRSLHVLGTATFTKPIFENVVVTGMILAEDGKKMSKSKKNFPDPRGLLEQYGPDAFRLYLLNSPVVRSEPLRFKEKDVEQILKDVILPLHNVVNFFSTYAKVDDFNHPGTEIYFMRHAHTDSELKESVGENGDVVIEDVRTKETPLSKKGLVEIRSEQFIEEVGRINPDIILCSAHLRAIQTAQGAQKVMKDIYNKEIEIISDQKYGGGIQTDTVEEIYQEIQEMYAGKKILLVSHHKRYCVLRNYLMQSSHEIKSLDETQKHITTTGIIKLPLLPLTNELDQWMYAELYSLIEKLDTELAGYKLDTATSLLVSFIEKLTNRYLRRSRRRFRANGMDDDKRTAYHTLYEVVTTYLKLLAPFAPFTTEYLWKGLQDFCNNGNKHRSIHLEFWPLQGKKYINETLMEEIQTVRTIIKQALFVRAKSQIKVKIPLRKMEVQIN